jgi:aldehyde dehydrogenase (NAD+)
MSSTSKPVSAGSIAEPRMYIDGDWVDPTNDSRRVEGINPATEVTISRTPEGTAQDLDRAVTAARVAFETGPWPRMKPRERAAFIFRFAEFMDKRAAELDALAVAESGWVKGPYSGTKGSVAFVQDCAERTLTYQLTDALLSEASPMSSTLGLRLGGGAVLKEPQGVVGGITPFNAPALINPWVIGPALATGNTLVLKPSPYTPLQALFFAEVLEQAELPPGVFNLVFDGPGVGEALTTHPGVDMISFVGSADIGRKIMAQAATNITPLILELGGKSPDIIFADTQVEEVVPTAIQFIGIAGQGCSLSTRILVEEPIHDQVVEGMVTALRAVKVGDPSQPGIGMGPLIRESARQRVEAYVASGLQDGGQIVCGGRRPPDLDKGFFLEPTVFTNIDNRTKIAQEEIFGPVAVVIPFRDEDDAVRIANESPYGLAARINSTDTARAWRVAKQIRAGFKQSGFGRIFGDWGFDEYVRTKTVSWPVR